MLNLIKNYVWSVVAFHPGAFLWSMGVNPNKLYVYMGLGLKNTNLALNFMWGRLVRGTPTAGVLIHWVIISRRWERIQQRDSESPVNTDSPRKQKCCDAFPGREITGPKNTQNWHHFTRTSSSTHSNYLCLLTLLHLVLLSSFSM